MDRIKTARYHNNIITHLFFPPNILEFVKPLQQLGFRD
jgi:hypothetical protein